MAVRSPTQWIANSGTGYTVPSSNDLITTQNNKILTTQSNIKLQIQPEIHSPKFAGIWTLTAKNTDHWTPASGSGYVKTIGNELFTDNLGNFITDNSGNNLVTNPTYNIPKFATKWAASGV